MMKFYNQPHEFYCGIDVHANSMYVCVVDHAGKKQLHKKIKRLDLYLEQHAKVCVTFNYHLTGFVRFGEASG